MSMCHRRVSPDIWDDEWFIEQDDAMRNLWWIILTGKQVLPIPGLQNIGPGALAEKLRRSHSDVAELFAKLIEQKKIEFDDRFQVLRVPNAPKFNVPDNANQVLGWWKVWQRLPPSSLKFAHVYALRESVDTALVEADPKKNNAFSDAWDKGFGTLGVTDTDTDMLTVRDHARASGVGSREYRVGSREGQLSVAHTVAPVLTQTRAIKEVFEYWSGRLAPRAKLDSKRTAIIEKALKTYTVEELCKAVDGTLLDPWRMGDNPNRIKYTDVGLVFRDSEKIEPMIELANTSLTSGFVPSKPSDAAALRVKKTEDSLKPSPDALSPLEQAAEAMKLKMALSAIGNVPQTAETQDCMVNKSNRRELEVKWGYGQNVRS